jgi:hypothetical protein
MQDDKPGIIEDNGLSTRDSCGYCKGKAGESVSHGDSIIASSLARLCVATISPRPSDPLPTGMFVEKMSVYAYQGIVFLITNLYDCTQSLHWTMLVVIRSA